MSALTQYIIVFIILGCVLGWLIYKLFIKKGGNHGSCCGCSMAENCKKMEQNLDNTQDKKAPNCCGEKDCCPEKRVK